MRKLLAILFLMIGLIASCNQASPMEIKPPADVHISYCPQTAGHCYDCHPKPHINY